jgi:(p)ppGpp synthase/HD superfamily hydrolase
MNENFNQLKMIVRAWLGGRGMHTALRAVNLGLEWHTGTRKDGTTPEFIHQLSQIQYVRSLADVAGLEDVITVIALHDLPEDYRYNIKWVHSEFGSVVGDSVERMSKKYYGVAADKSPENYYYSIGNDSVSSIAKGCDRVHNQSTLIGVFKIEKIKEFIAETEQYVLPMLKEARKNFPFQEVAYTALRYRLKEQIYFLRAYMDMAELAAMSVEY